MQALTLEQGGRAPPLQRTVGACPPQQLLSSHAANRLRQRVEPGLALPQCDDLRAKFPDGPRQRGLAFAGVGLELRRTQRAARSQCLDDLAFDNINR